MEINYDAIEYDSEHECNKPKFELNNPEIFTKTRKILGNIIVNRMKTSGGTDIDWLIEHNGHFIIWEIRTFNDDIVTISKAQMNMFQILFKQLKSCDFFFIAHDDIDFKNPKDSVWIFSNREWERTLKEKCESNTTNSNKYVIHRSILKKIDVKILRDMIDASWATVIR
ncbi:hypothetical protein [Candidatus Nitrosarchaeum limnium]|uniref:Uncharacterized protein n=1 Tax=Candidatus Nitrosarchaeum limnium BG20 TaxID=859192 RepID=S2E619_9ARCH|nr:hypothetical protein [Candidatus Nitrosarchaeum limnium]EPA06183.1 hypothetical protein BG20_I0832 [Candidatus Nitrosarchaeum limnium BG20]